MKHPREEADRWLRQAQHDLEVAAKNIDNGYYADACYAAEQAAQKALKGYLYWRGDRLLHSYSLS